MSEKQWFPRRHITPLGILVLMIAGFAVLGVALASGMLRWGIPINPGGNVPPEKLVLRNYTIGYDQNQQNPTVVTLWLENDGVANSNLATVTMQDQTSNTVPITTVQLNGTIGPGGRTAKVVVDTLVSGFYFVHGHSYELTVKTTMDNRFGFQANYS